MTVLEARGLVMDFGRFRAVDDVSFALQPGKMTALVGQSGSGKSTVAQLLAGLQTPTAGEILLDGTPARVRRRRDFRRYTGDVQMVLQDPFASLNPAHTVRYHLTRALRNHGFSPDGEVERLLETVRLAAKLANRFPHELSGGERQRVSLARALAARPRVLLADEPVSMLDVTIRLGVLTLIDQLREENNLAVLYITHDLATARQFTSELMVMHKGKIVERGDSSSVIDKPQHPYTRDLLAAIPHPSRR
ncbi:ABC transporter ATP-binding protein [Fodinicola acaciae]|uniref:ABC transporter ATP-binding protein n=1 Tax=Fodinicola acaciae TaxID=2681555 RepID=UPI0013D43F8F|nr:ATP-binding cassette domain-containing protein [Fodinicola acaciae]